MKNKRGVLAALCVVVLVMAGTWYAVVAPEGTRKVSADFAAADGIHPGNRVHVLGVPVGVVESLQPRGATIRVTMAISSDVDIPREANAYIMNPAVISDRFVELGPSYTGGPALPDGGVIPAERSHAPVRWDKLMASVDELLAAVAPAGGDGDIGALLHDSAQSIGGRGPEIRNAVRTISGATDVIADDPRQTAALIDNLDALTRVLAENKSTIDSVSGSVARLGDAYERDQDSVRGTVQRLSSVLGQVDTLVNQRGEQLTSSLHNVGGTAAKLSDQQQDLATTLDRLPLVFNNFDRAITPDERLRIRLDVSTNLSQFPATAQLCEKLPIPLCHGAGITNPIPLPPRLDPLLTAGPGPAEPSGGAPGGGR